MFGDCPTAPIKSVREHVVRELFSLLLQEEGGLRGLLLLRELSSTVLTSSLQRTCSMCKWPSWLLPGGETPWWLCKEEKGTKNLAGRPANHWMEAAGNHNCLHAAPKSTLLYRFAIARASDFCSYRFDDS